VAIPASPPHAWHELLDAMVRQDPLGYLRMRCTTPVAPHVLCRLLVRERRELVAALGQEVWGLEDEVEAFYADVTAEACRWTHDDKVWPWADAARVPARASSTLGLLRDSTRSILTELDLKRLLPLLVERATAISRAEAAFLALCQPDQEGLDLIESRGLAGPLPRQLAVSKQDVEKLMAGRAAVLVGPADAPWLVPLLAGRKHVLLAPLWHHDQLIGVVGCHDPAGGAAAADVLGMLADLTAIAIRNAAYYREIHHKAAALHASNEDLRDLDRMKDLFLATVSHELRTPLNFITGFGSILLEAEDLPPLLDEQRYFVRKMLDGAYQLLGLVNDLLDYSRIRAGQLSLSRATFDPLKLLEACATSYTPLAAQHGLHFELVVEGALPLVEGDRQRIEQVLRNMVANAFKFTAQGGQVTVLAHATDHLRIEVRDDGVGIPPEAQSRLFQHFSRVGDPVGPAGTGLGLAIYKSLVEAHAGEIGMRSPLHQSPFGERAGSAFWFTLPVSTG
jgi:signal transduction histidine kinase